MQQQGAEDQAVKVLSAHGAGGDSESEQCMNDDGTAQPPGPANPA